MSNPKFLGASISNRFSMSVAKTFAFGKFLAKSAYRLPVPHPISRIFKFSAVKVTPLEAIILEKTFEALRFLDLTPVTDSDA